MNTKVMTPLTYNPRFGIDFLIRLTLEIRRRAVQAGATSIMNASIFSFTSRHKFPPQKV